MRRILGSFLGLALLSALTAVPATANPFPDQIDLPPGWQPEGITSNGTTLYVGSLFDGAIWRGTLQSGTGDTFIEGVEDQGPREQKPNPAQRQAGRLRRQCRLQR